MTCLVTLFYCKIHVFKKIFNFGYFGIFNQLLFTQSTPFEFFNVRIFQQFFVNW